jgi:hypothetical protein
LHEYQSPPYWGRYLRVPTGKRPSRRFRAHSRLGAKVQALLIRPQTHWH